mmetsp:Transcript_47705/g.118172  ORF Transcript_47705/g.118172 Transcript_47705/m.118172 type:complete len:92 (-) Transcript_47705:362-637(-)
MIFSMYAQVVNGTKIGGLQHGRMASLCCGLGTKRHVVLAMGDSWTECCSKRIQSKKPHMPARVFYRTIMRITCKCRAPRVGSPSSVIYLHI